MKIASWNVNSLRVRLPHVLEWLTAVQPDVLGLQETKLTDDKFPVDAFSAIGYQAVYAGQPTYNGVALLTREPASDIVTELTGLEDTQKRVLAATVGEVRVLNLYVPNGQSVESDKYQYKLRWLSALLDFVTTELDEHQLLAVLGDFNIAPEDRDVHNPEEWSGHVLVSEPERKAFQALLGCGLTDTFRLFEQDEGHFSWWDYRAAAFRRNRGLRIDHILVSGELASLCRYSRIDIEPRRWERPSDHAPVLAEFDIV